MNKETLARAKELEEDIRQMESALTYYKRGRWSCWGINDSASLFHFEFCKNWNHLNETNTQDLPTWLNKPLMEVVERELERCKHELETLGDGRKADAVDDAEEVETPAMSTGEHNKPHKASRKDIAARTAARLISWMINSATFCLLLGVAGLDLSAREFVAYSLMLGLITGSIDNIEWAMIELFKKEDRSYED